MSSETMRLQPEGPSEQELSAADTPAATANSQLAARALARPELIVLLAAAAALYLWGLSKNGMANEYYAATVRSMASGWHNFLYGSFDMNGVMTVDKPPLAFWVQALSVKLFGYSSLSMLVPQALMGVGTVALTYDIVSRRFGRWPAFAAGAVLAVTPMAVAISRHNNPDALLILLSVAALWFVLRALEDGKTRWIVLAGAAVGGAFTTKMGAGLLVLPALFAAYLWAAPVSRSRALVQLLIGGGVFVAVAGAWPLLMALTPAPDRPWISGTTDNSIWSLITQYNGLGRLNGQQGGPGGIGGPGGGPGGAGGGVFGGEAGWARLFNSALGPQVAWLTGFAVVSGIAVTWFSRLSARDANTGWIVAVGGCFATIAIAFSFAKGIFHPYYSSQLAPFTAMLVGAGLGTFTGGDQAADDGRKRRYWGAAALAAGAVTTLWVLSNATADRMDAWQAPMALIVLSAAAFLAIAGADQQIRKWALIAGVAALLVAPAAWSVATLGHATSGTFPAGGSQAAGGGLGGPGGGFGGPGGGAFGGQNSQLTSAIAYAKAHGGGTIGVESQSTAAPYVAQSGADVAGIGGFSGRESSVSVSWLADAVAESRLRWIYTGSGGIGGGFADGRQGSQSAINAAEQVCKQVNDSSLYDCAGQSQALQRLAN